MSWDNFSFWESLNLLLFLVRKQRLSSTYNTNFDQYWKRQIQPNPLIFRITHTKHLILVIGMNLVCHVPLIYDYMNCCWNLIALGPTRLTHQRFYWQRWTSYTPQAPSITRTLETQILSFLLQDMCPQKQIIEVGGFFCENPLILKSVCGVFGKIM